MPIHHLEITPAMLRMLRRDNMFMFRKSVAERARKGESYDDIAKNLLETETDDDTFDTKD